MAVVKRVEVFSCDFCGLTQDEVPLLVRGPNNVCICDACIGICSQIVADKDKRDAGPAGDIPEHVTNEV